MSFKTIPPPVFDVPVIQDDDEEESFGSQQTNREDQPLLPNAQQGKDIRSLSLMLPVVLLIHRFFSFCSCLLVGLFRTFLHMEADNHNDVLVLSLLS